MKRYKGIAIDNIFCMLQYVWGVNQSLNSMFYTSITDDNDCKGLFDLFARLLTQSIIIHFKRGLCREYISITDELSVLRGRLNFSETIKKEMHNKAVLVCDIDEFSENNIYNQILKTATLKLLKLNCYIGNNRKSALKHCLFLLKDCDSIQNCKTINWQALKFNATNASYATTLQLCRWILERSPFIESGDKPYLLSDFDDKEIEHLFEMFIAAYYRKHFQNLSVVHGQTIYWKGLEYDPEDNYLPVMRTDVILKHKNLSQTLIIDAKFYGNMYQQNTQHIRPMHMYQIFSYVENYQTQGSERINGLLIYAKPEKDDFPDKVIDYIIDDKSFGVMALDLNKGFTDIKKYLNDVCYKYFKIRPTVQ